MKSRVGVLSLCAICLAIVFAPVAGAAPAKPTFALSTSAGQPGQQLRYQAEGSGASQLAFVYDWGDGTTLREPATGFRSVDPTTGTVLGATVSHSWRAAGTYSVTVAAIDPSGASTRSDPLAVTISAPPSQNDCGTGKDAGNSLASATPAALPASCSGTLDGNGFDSTDVYSFSVPRSFQLLTLTVTPPGLWSCCPPEINLVDPTGAIRAGYSIPTLCADPQVFCKTSATAPVEKAVGFTLDQAGTWKLILGGDVNTTGFTSFVTGTYGFTLAAGGGGDDCVSGRSAALASPFDAPNQNVGIRLLDRGQVDCSGSLPFADRDFEDLYTFPATAGEPIALSIQPTDGSTPCDGRLWGEIAIPGVNGAGFPFGCVGNALYQAGATGTAGIDMHAEWTARSQTLPHRIRLATGSHHTGDCFTGADASNSAGAATAMPVPTCVGNVSAADTGDWYAFTANAGDQIDMFRVPTSLPAEIVDPSGAARGSGSVLADQTGTWKVHVATNLGALPHFEGAYGVRVARTPQAAPAPSPSPSPAPSPSDTVSVTRAEWTASTGQLRLDATSTSSSATLSAYVTSSGALIGTLTNNGGGRYSLQKNVAPNPQNVTVRSSLGGSASGTVALK